MRISWILFLFLLLGLSASGQGVPARPVSVKQLTNVIDAYPMLSPDGTQLLFQSNRSGKWELYTMKPDGSGLRQLTHEAGDPASPVWSPDGSKIAFALETPDGGSDIFLINADGAGKRRLTNHPGDDAHPHWHPDGTRIIFNSARTTPDLKADWSKQWHEVFSIRIDETDLRQHTHCRTVCTYPSFSPNGRKILYRKVTDTPAFRWDLTSAQRNSEVFIADEDGSHEVNLSNSAAYDGWPLWSPDGTKIAFSSNRSGPAYMGQIYLVSPDGTGLQKLTDGPGAFIQPSWSRDGRRIYAYQAWESADAEHGNLAVIELQ